MKRPARLSAIAFAALVVAVVQAPPRTLTSPTRRSDSVPAAARDEEVCETASNLRLGLWRDQIPGCSPGSWSCGPIEFQIVAPLGPLRYSIWCVQNEGYDGPASLIIRIARLAFLNFSLRRGVFAASRSHSSTLGLVQTVSLTRPRRTTSQSKHTYLRRILPTPGACPHTAAGFQGRRALTHGAAQAGRAGWSRRAR